MPPESTKQAQSPNRYGTLPHDLAHDATEMCKETWKTRGVIIDDG